MYNYDIGIMTFWGVPNYGTFAQAYALQKVLQENSNGRDVRQIAHLDTYHYNFYYNKQDNYKIWNKGYWKALLSKSPEKDLDLINKKNMFDIAYSSIPHTKEIDLSNTDEICFKKIFLGSDIVWDYTVKVFNEDPMLFGSYLNVSEVNSYAASFGTVKIDMDVPDYVIEALKKMTYISVRDENSADIVEKITGRRPIVVLDPVWMWDFNSDENIKIPELDKYILIYGQDFTSGFIENLIEYASKKNLKLVALDCNEDEYTWCDILIKQQDLSPYDWIGYFKGADSVATSTFHGLTFGLVFRKKIAFCRTDFIIAKIGEFLKQLDLYDLFNEKDDVNQMLSYNWDYEKINRYIEKKKNISLDFLKKACG